ncbi:MAG: hypothetical protein QFX37_08695 [Archaeoglobales archaeon]|nr:hypothetical protein [Archaeoglobales archaeon]
MGEDGIAEIKEFVEKLRKEIGELKAIFFGSRVRGDLDVFCYTEEEFEKKKNEIGTVKKALEEGILL